MRKRLAAGLAGLLLFITWGCGKGGGSGAMMPSAGPPAARSGGGTQEVSYQDADGWTIYGDFYPVQGAAKAVVLLHQRGGSADDWKPLTPRLNDEGISALAIDQRGAGRSKGKANGDNAPWDTTPDIAGAIAWLGTRGVKPPHIGLAGASYGANNALIFAARGNPPIPAVALLSPGTDYHGLKVEGAAKSYKGALLVLAASGDSITGGGPDLIRRADPKATVKMFDGGEHGTKLFDSQPEAAAAVAEFFQGKL